MDPIKPRTIPIYGLMAGDVYDLIYADKDYAGESLKLAGIIEQNCDSGGSEVLEAACGTGLYMYYLSDNYEVSGFDISPEQVEAAKRRLPGNHIFQADMQNFETGRQYDAVLCLFSSIAYLKTKAGLDKAVANLARHTKPGGLVIVEAWLQPEEIIPGYTSLEANFNDDISVVRMGKLRKKGKLTVLDMHHMLGGSKGIGHFLEIHEMALYTDEEFADAFHKAGLGIYIDPQGLIGRHLCVGKKPL